MGTVQFFVDTYVLRQKNIRTKGCIEKPDACSSKLYIRLSFQCIAPAVAQTTAPFVEKNKSAPDNFKDIRISSTINN